MEELELYSRRNCVKIQGIPVELPVESHQLGIKPNDASERDLRSKVVKFVELSSFVVL